MRVNLKFGLGLKAFLIIILMLLLWIPLQFIDSLTRERMRYQDSVVRGIAQDYSERQLITGPVLVLRLRKIERHWKTLDNGQRIEERYAKQVRLYFLPERFNLEGELKTELRHRGIYQARLYQGKHHISGRFELPADFGIKENFADYRLESAYLSVGISDVRGIRNDLKVQIDGKTLDFFPSSAEGGLGGGIHAPLESLTAQAHGFDFAFDLEMQGTSDFSVAPVGRESEVKLTSDWPHPSFFGSFLPIARDISANGFNAHWKTTFFASNMEEILQQHLHECQNSNSNNSRCNRYDDGYKGFGVSLIEPVDQYRKTERAIKYGLLFIGLTFAVFFLFEVLKRLPVHPMQYAMVGFALALFFLLLLSLSEHIGFLPAYLTSSAASLLLIGSYVSGVLRSLKRGAALAGLLLVLYGLLYGLLGAEDYALLMGTLLIFGLLAVVMLLTRKLDWYAFSHTPETQDK